MNAPIVAARLLWPAAFLIAAAGMMLLIALPSLRAKREVALQE